MVPATYLALRPCPPLPRWTFQASPVASSLVPDSAGENSVCQDHRIPALPFPSADRGLFSLRRCLPSTMMTGPVGAERSRRTGWGPETQVGPRGRKALEMPPLAVETRSLQLRALELVCWVQSAPASSAGLCPHLQNGMRVGPRSWGVQ